MAGYSGFSKSNNAVAAEQFDRFPASRLAAKLKVKTAAIKALMQTSEWHHTSSYYNTTDYYDGELLLLLFAEDEPADWGYDEEEIAEGHELLQKLRDWRPAKKGAKCCKDCTVQWLEWGGTRKRPTATERKESGCTVEFKGGAFCTVTFTDGSTLRKKTDRRGFEVFEKGGSRVWF